VNSNEVSHPLKDDPIPKVANDPGKDQADNQRLQNSIGFAHVNEIYQGQERDNRDHHKEGEFPGEHTEGSTRIHSEGEVKPTGDHSHEVPRTLGVIFQTAEAEGPVFCREIGNQGQDASHKKDHPTLHETPQPLSSSLSGHDLLENFTRSQQSVRLIRRDKFMQALIDDFLLEIKIERGSSKHTSDAYQRDLGILYKWLAKRGLDDLDEITPSLLRTFLMEEKARGLAATTISRRKAAITMFFRYLVAEGQIPETPADQLDVPKAMQSIPNTLSTLQVEALLQSPDTSQPLGIRDRALLELLYASGARVSEVVGLDIDTVDESLRAGLFGETTLRVFGKGSKERLVPLSVSALRALDRYIKEVRPQLNKQQCPAFLLSRTGLRLDRRDAWRSVKKYLLIASLPESVSPHTLRHSFATHMLSGGADLRVVQELLGHARVTTTQKYTHVDRDRLLSIHKKFHPLG
jgi:integrase/recombinase XerD